MIINNQKNNKIMKYIIDFRFKAIHSIIVSTKEVLLTCKRGRSETLPPLLEKLQEVYTELSNMKSAPFEKEQIKQVEKIETLLGDFLHLPENLESVGETLLSHTKELLGAIDPFTFSYDESSGIRRSRIVEFAKELQVYLKSTLLRLEGLASSLVEEKAIVEEVMQDIRRISQKGFKSEEKGLLQILFAAFDTYAKQPTHENVSFFFDAAVSLEHLFKGSPKNDTF
jgi:Ribonuclease G/E